MKDPVITDNDIEYRFTQPRDYVDETADDDFRERVSVGAKFQNAGILAALFSKPERKV